MEDNLVKKELINFIFEFRGLKVMIDADLSMIYGVTTKALKQQVKRNKDRFPADFMFELTDDEKKQLVTICDRLTKLRHSSVNPMAFTEHGVAMLSSVLHSEKAILINIEIMRAFSRYRALIKENEELTRRIDKLDRKINHLFKFFLPGLLKLFKILKDQLDLLKITEATPT